MWYKSKKIWATAIAAVLAIVGQIAPEWKEGIEQVLYAIMAYVVGQGVADMGKEASKVAPKE